MGLPAYRCSDDLPERIPELLRLQGMECEVEPAQDSVEHNYRIRARHGTVSFSGFRDEDANYMFFLTCSLNPLFWLADHRLLCNVESVLVAEGAVRIKQDGKN
jgi:hypothetical protein